MESLRQGSAFLFTFSLIPVFTLLNEQIAEEIIFPANAAYSIITYYLTYSEAHMIRHYIFAFLLSFCEIFYISILKSFFREATRGIDPFRSDISLLFLEFSLIFIATKIMNKKEIYSEFKASQIRTVVFLVKGFFRARALVLGLRIITGSNTIEISQVQFLLGIFSSGIIAALPGLVYVIDAFLCRDIPVREINTSDMIWLWKTGVIVSVFSMVFELFIPCSLEIVLGSSLSSIFIYVVYLSYYYYSSNKYSQMFTVKTE